MEYAIESAKGRQKNKTRIKVPFVIGALVELGNCLNILEPRSVGVLKDAYSSLERITLSGEKQMPVNRGAHRQLDCDVITHLHKMNEQKGLKNYETVRSAFVEGNPIYPGSNFTDRLHIELCVHNPELIKGYFLPTPIEKYNPFLRKDFSI